MSGNQPNPNLQREIRATIYQLKKEYGAPVDVYKMDAASTDYKTGVKTATKSVISVRKAVVMPATTLRKQSMGISYLSASKPFASQGGQGWDGTTTAFIFEGSDLPGYDWEVEDWIVYRDRRYDVAEIETLGHDAGWLIIGKEVKGAVPERIIQVNVVSSLNLEGAGSGSVT
jgi:hypothetical protein